MDLIRSAYNGMSKIRLWRDGRLETWNDGFKGILSF